MKKILYILFAVTLFTACSKDDPASDDGGGGGNNGGTTQNYTSLVVKNESRYYHPILIIAYLKDGIYYRIGQVLNFSTGISSEEIKINEQYMANVYLFYQADDASYWKTVKPLTLEKDKYNSIAYTNQTIASRVLNLNDPSQFPVAE